MTGKTIFAYGSNDFETKMEFLRGLISYVLLNALVENASRHILQWFKQINTYSNAFHIFWYNELLYTLVFIDYSSRHQNTCVVNFVNIWHARICFWFDWIQIHLHSLDMLCLYVDLAWMLEWYRNLDCLQRSGPCVHLSTLSSRQFVFIFR